MLHRAYSRRLQQLRAIYATIDATVAQVQRSEAQQIARGGQEAAGWLRLRG
jgi:hypothetical protein